jgi:hypothetical protein
MRRIVRPGSWCAALVFSVAATAAGQPTVTDRDKRIQFDPSAPTARGTALAGVGIGMPDDASAAMTNPAALRLLVRSEASGSVGGRFAQMDLVAQPAGTRPSSLIFEDHTEGTYELGFSFAYPSSRVAAAAYQRTLSELTGWHQYGGAASISLASNFSIGGALHVDQLTTFDESGEIIEQLKPTFQVGALYSPHPRVHLGVVHRRGAVHDMTSVFYDSTGTAIRGSHRFTLHLPDVTGAGAGVRLGERARVLAEVTRTRYSQLAEGYAGLLFASTETALAVAVRDSTELRIAGEYAVPAGSNSAVIRGGVWREERHPVVYTGGEPVWQALFPQAEGARVHGTFGAGIGSERYELSVGADLAGDFRRAMVSFIARFR